MIEVLPAEDENIEEKMNELKEEVEETKNIFKLFAKQKRQENNEPEIEKEINALENENKEEEEKENNSITLPKLTEEEQAEKFKNDNMKITKFNKLNYFLEQEMIKKFNINENNDMEPTLREHSDKIKEATIVERMRFLDKPLIHKNTNYFIGGILMKTKDKINMNNGKGNHGMVTVNNMSIRPMNSKILGKESLAISLKKMPDSIDTIMKEREEELRWKMKEKQKKEMNTPTDNGDCLIF